MPSIDLPTLLALAVISGNRASKTVHFFFCPHHEFYEQLPVDLKDITSVYRALISIYPQLVYFDLRAKDRDDEFWLVPVKHDFLQRKYHNDSRTQSAIGTAIQNKHKPGQAGVCMCTNACQLYHRQAITVVVANKNYTEMKIYADLRDAPFGDTNAEIAYMENIIKQGNPFLAPFELILKPVEYESKCADTLVYIKIQQPSRLKFYRVHIPMYHNELVSFAISANVTTKDMIKNELLRVFHSQFPQFVGCTIVESTSGIYDVVPTEEQIRHGAHLRQMTTFHEKERMLEVHFPGQPKMRLVAHYDHTYNAETITNEINRLVNAKSTETIDRKNVRLFQVGHKLIAKIIPSGSNVSRIHCKIANHLLPFVREHERAELSQSMDTLTIEVLEPRTQRFLFNVMSILHTFFVEGTSFIIQKTPKRLNHYVVQKPQDTIRYIYFLSQLRLLAGEITKESMWTIHDVELNKCTGHSSTFEFEFKGDSKNVENTKTFIELVNKLLGTASFGRTADDYDINYETRELQYIKGRKKVGNVCYLHGRGYCDKCGMDKFLWDDIEETQL